MTKHTPGPWTVERKVEVYGPSRGFGSEPICDCGEGEVVRAECEANARLIAAAPDLLVVAQCYEDMADEIEAALIGDTLEEFRNLRALNRAAIAKAEGQT